MALNSANHSKLPEHKEDEPISIYDIPELQPRSNVDEKKVRKNSRTWMMRVLIKGISYNM